MKTPPQNPLWLLSPSEKSWLIQSCDVSGNGWIPRDEPWQIPLTQAGFERFHTKWLQAGKPWVALSVQRSSQQPDVALPFKSTGPCWQVVAPGQPHDRSLWQATAADISMWKKLLACRVGGFAVCEQPQTRTPDSDEKAQTESRMFNRLLLIPPALAVRPAERYSVLGWLPTLTSSASAALIALGSTLFPWPLSQPSKPDSSGEQIFALSGQIARTCRQIQERMEQSRPAASNRQTHDDSDQ